MNEELKVIITAEISKLKSELQKGKKEVESFGKKAKASFKEFNDEVQKVGDATKTGLAVVGGAIAGAATALLALDGATKEYRENQAKLNTAFETAGASAGVAAVVYNDLYRVLGEDDVAVEAAGHLAQLTTNQADLSQWTTICQGVYATFGDSLPIESLTEAANETAKTGSLTGALADALNWAGVNEEAFQAKLDACNTEAEREALIRSTLNGLYSDAAANYETNNAAILAQNEAQAQLNANLASVGEAMAPINTLFLQFANEILAVLIPYIQDFAANHLPALQSVLSTVAEAIGQVIGWIANNWELITTLGTVVLTVAAAFSVFSTVMGIVNGVMAMSPISWIVAGIVALIAAIALCVVYWDEIKVALQNFAKAATKWLSGLWDSFSKWLTDMADKFSEWFGEVAEGFGEWWDDLVEGWNEFWSGVGTLLGEWWASLTEGFSEWFTGLQEGWTNFWSRAGEIISSGISKVVEFFTNLWNKLVEIATSIWNALSEKFNSIKTTLTTIASNIWTSLSTTFTNIWTTITTIATNIWTTLSNIWTNIQTTVTSIVTNISTTLSNIWTTIQTTITTIINTIKTNLQTAWEAIKTNITTTITNISTTLSTTWNTIKTTITTVVNTIKTTLTTTWNTIKTTITTVVTNISTSLSTTWNSIKTTISTIISNISTNMTTTWNTIKTTITTAVTNAWTTVTEKFNSIKTSISTALNGAWTTVTTILTNIKNKFSTIFESAKTIVSNAINTIKGYFNFSWSLPKLKLPHFSISGKFSLNPPSVPKISISWYKLGGVFDSPTLFGYGNGNLGGLGEDGAEAVVPLEKNTQWLDRIAERLAAKQGSSPIILQVDGKTFAQISIDSINDLTRQTGSLPLVLA